MDCKEFDHLTRTLDPFTSTPEQRDAIKNHFDTCPHCQEKMYSVRHRSRLSPMESLMVQAMNLADKQRRDLESNG